MKDFLRVRRNKKNMKNGFKFKSRGQAIVEFTLMIPLIIIIVGGLSDLGFAFFLGMATQNAVREGARIAATTEPLAANNTTVQNEVLSRIPAISQFTVTSVTNSPPSSGDCDAIVTVTATGTYNFAFLRYLGYTTMQVSRSATMRYEHVPLCT